MKTSRKNYINSVRADFLSGLLKPWQKRNNRLLHIYANHGVEPSFFWEMGFDVSVLCATQKELEQCQERNGKKVEYFIGKSEHLPFDEKLFDYVVLTHSLGSSIEDAKRKKLYHSQNEIEQVLEKIIQEAQRVSTKSVCILEFSSFAFTKIQPALSPLLLRKLVKLDTYTNSNEEENLTKLVTALHLPSFLWTKKPLPFSSYPLNIPFGSLMAVTLDHSPFLMTSLPLHIQQAATEISS